MARRDDILGVTGAETLIGSGVEVKGALIGEGDVSVDGTLDGDIRSSGGEVVIGINGVVHGNVTGNNLSVAGELTGNVRVIGDVTITESGQIKGNIKASSLSIIPGGRFIGTNVITTGEA